MLRKVDEIPLRNLGDLALKIMQLIEFEYYDCVVTGENQLIVFEFGIACQYNGIKLMRITAFESQYIQIEIRVQNGMNTILWISILCEHEAINIRLAAIEVLSRWIIIVRCKVEPTTTENILKIW